MNYFMRLSLTILSSLPLLYFVSLGAQAQELSIKDEISDEIRSTDKKHYLTLTMENDLFAKGSDRDYTNGFRIGWFNLNKKTPSFTKKMHHLLPFLDINETSSTFYSIGQNLFSPRDISAMEQDPNDRPWAAFLYGSMGMVTLEDTHVDEVELTLGVVGPLALGEELQKTIHDVMGSLDPQGWHNQLKNEPGLMVSWQRRWPEPLLIDARDTFLTLSPHAGFTVGNIYTYANAGVVLKLSSEHSRWDDKPLQVRPAMPGTGFFVPSKKLEWEIFAGADGRAVAHNIFLDGNTFTDSHHVDKKPFVADLSAGVAFTLGNTRISYISTYRTKEFESQSDESLFGGISVGYNF